MSYTIEVFVKQLPKEEVFERYVKKEVFGEACKQCPFYGKMWSCPPDMPSLEEYMKEQNTAYLIGVKVNYSETLQWEGSTAEKAQEIRDYSYEKVKRNLLLALLELEKILPAGKCIGAGRCGLCKECTREEGKECRYPAMRRYSTAAFGFDCGALMKEQLNLELQWKKDGGLPEYDVAVAAIFAHIQDMDSSTKSISLD